jgi:hypothetical protein
MNSRNADEVYLKVDVVAGGLWVNFVQSMTEQLSAQDEQCIQFYKHKNMIIFTSSNSRLLSELQTNITTFCSQYYDFVTFRWCNTANMSLYLMISSLANIQWYNLFHDYERLLKYMRYEDE